MPQDSQLLHASCPELSGALSLRYSEIIEEVIPKATTNVVSMASYSVVVIVEADEHEDVSAVCALLYLFGEEG
jgi:hypothetical protein